MPLPEEMSERSKALWRRAVTKALRVTEGSFPGSRTIQPDYFLERLDPMHHSILDLKPLFRQFQQDRTFTGGDFFEWMEARQNEPDLMVEYFDAERLRGQRMHFDGLRVTFPKARDFEEYLASLREEEVIFVLDKDDRFYGDVKLEKQLHHSSFLGGRPVAGAGTIVVRSGLIRVINDHSGHYQPGSDQMLRVARALAGNGGNPNTIRMRFTLNGRRRELTAAEWISGNH
ncbi:hypothetical protein [Granulicella sp. dw_53]|uniref:hypothetical protein n=1 Tax=Granulicella sp. dw_53 TaxID=2719792 RepID=UPI001BD50083|nr:hypothetical protein [Granulicella sp. dw_53]